MLDALSASTKRISEQSTYSSITDGIILDEITDRTTDKKLNTYFKTCKSETTETVTHLVDLLRLKLLI